MIVTVALMTNYKARYFDDWPVGEVIMTESHGMTEERIRSFAEEFDPQPFHTDPDAAEQSIFGGLIASGWHTGSVLMRLVTSVLGPSSLGSPGVDNLRWVAPVRPGDELRLRIEVLEARPSKSKPDRGIIRFGEQLINQRDEIVMTLEAILLIQRRP